MTWVVMQACASGSPSTFHLQVSSMGSMLTASHSIVSTKLGSFPGISPVVESITRKWRYCAGRGREDNQHSDTQPRHETRSRSRGRGGGGGHKGTRTGGFEVSRRLTIAIRGTRGLLLWRACTWLHSLIMTSRIFPSARWMDCETPLTDLSLRQGPTTHMRPLKFASSVVT